MRQNQLHFAEMNMFYFPLLVLKGIDFTTGYVYFYPGDLSKWQDSFVFCLHRKDD